MQIPRQIMQIFKPFMQIFWAIHINPHPWDPKTPMAQHNLNIKGCSPDQGQEKRLIKIKNVEEGYQTIFNKMQYFGAQ